MQIYIYLLVGAVALGAVPTAVVIFAAFAIRKKVSGMNSDNGSDRSHPLVIGTILSIRETGMTVHLPGRSAFSPECALTVGFTTREGQAVTAVGEALIAMVAIPQFQPGCTVPLRYDPANPANIRIVLDASPYELQQAQYR